MRKHFTFDDGCELSEYVGCKIEWNKDERSMKLTQPVLLQSYVDEFELPDANFTTPAVAGEVLCIDEKDVPVNEEKQYLYRKGVGKLLHMMKWTRPDIINSVREMTGFYARATQKHFDRMKRTLKFCVCTPNRGIFLQPTKLYDGSDNFEFVITGCSDSDFAKDREDRKSVSAYATWLNGAPVAQKSRKQKHVSLSVAEAEESAAVECAQEMLFEMNVIESIGFKVEMPMVLWVDNKATVDTSNNWSVGGRTRHVRHAFLRELKERGVLILKWIPTEKNASDIFTKNVTGPLLKTHVVQYCGEDEYG